MTAIERRKTPQPEEPERRFTPSAGDFRWTGVAVTEYKSDARAEGGFHNVIRQTLFGKTGEAIGFEVRYFEIAPGGWSSLERHQHAHAVIGLRGVGKILLGDEVRSLGFLDLAYIGPNCIHRLANESSEPFGFLCVVDAVRDRPQPLTAADASELTTNPETAAMIQK
jgi:quercetin dioxygenase-like cupin family protein